MNINDYLYLGSSFDLKLIKYQPLHRPSTTSNTRTQRVNNIRLQNTVEHSSACTCGSDFLPPSVRKREITTTDAAHTMQCIGPRSNDGPLPDTHCNRVIESFVRALTAEHVPVVPLFGTYLRWYRDCTYMDPSDHDLDVGIFATDWNRIDWTRVLLRSAWYNVLNYDFKSGYDMAFRYLEMQNVQRESIQNVTSPLKWYLSAAGGRLNCDIDVWVMYNEPRTKTNWRCDNAGGVKETRVFGPVDEYVAVNMNAINGWYVPSNPDLVLTQNYGKDWRIPLGSSQYYAVDHTYIQNATTKMQSGQAGFVEDDCVSMDQAFATIGNPCTCYDYSKIAQMKLCVMWRQLMIVVWLVVPVVLGVGVGGDKCGFGSYASSYYFVSVNVVVIIVVMVFGNLGGYFERWRVESGET